jgi:hypothetical protein
MIGADLNLRKSLDVIIGRQSRRRPIGVAQLISVVVIFYASVQVVEMQFQPVIAI